MTTRRRGRPPHPDILTPAEWRVLEHLREGRTNADIAIRIGVSPETVKYHVSNMLSKLGLQSREELAEWRPGRERVIGRWWTFAAPIAVREAGVAAVVILGFGALLAVAAWTAMGSDDSPEGATTDDAVDQPDDDPVYPGRLLFAANTGDPLAEGSVYVLDPSTGDFQRHRGGSGLLPQWSPSGAHVVALRILPPVDTPRWPDTFTHFLLGPADPPFPPRGERASHSLSLVPPYLSAVFVSDREEGLLDLRLSAIPAWHPSGAQLVYTADPGGPGQGVTTLDPSSGVVTLSTSQCYYPAWSPDGTHGVCVSPAENAFDLLLGPVDEYFNGDLQPLEFESPPSFDGYDLHPAVSSSGRYVVWWRHPADGGVPHVYVADLDVAPHPVHNLGPGYHPRWSPTDDRLVFTQPSGESTTIAVAAAPSWEPQPLRPADANDHSPAWSSDGEHIAFVSHRQAGHGEVFISPVDGTDLHRIELNFVGQVIFGDDPLDIISVDWAERPADASWP